MTMNIRKGVRGKVALRGTVNFRDILLILIFESVAFLEAILAVVPEKSLILKFFSTYSTSRVFVVLLKSKERFKNNIFKMLVGCGVTLFMFTV